MEMEYEEECPFEGCYQTVRYKAEDVKDGMITCPSCGGRFEPCESCGSFRCSKCSFGSEYKLRGN